MLTTWPLKPMTVVVGEQFFWTLVRVMSCFDVSTAPVHNDCVHPGSTKEKPTKDDIVVEMKNNPKNEEAVLLKAVNGEKKGPNDQVTVVVSEYTCRKREKAKPRNHSNKHLHK